MLAVDVCSLLCVPFPLMASGGVCKVHKSEEMFGMHSDLRKHGMIMFASVCLGFIFVVLSGRVLPFFLMV